MPLAIAKRAGQYMRLAYDAVQLRRSEEASVQQSVRNHIVERLGRLHGLPLKLGQMVSLTEDSDEGVRHSFQDLQENVEPISLDSAVELLEAAWNQPVDRILRSIEPAEAAASLGQVHRATLLDGNSVAIKVQYPGIAKAIRSDLTLLGWLGKPLGMRFGGEQLQRYQKEISRVLHEELDYIRESENQIRSWTIARNFPLIEVPRVIPKLCKPSVLVTHWMESTAFRTSHQLTSTTTRYELAQQLPAFFFDSLFKHQLVHADWHPGNIRITKSNDEIRLGLLDFGCVFSPSAQDLSSLKSLLFASHDVETTWRLMLQLGFDKEKLAPLKNRLPQLISALAAPFRSPHGFNFSEWSLKEQVSEVLGDDRWNFRLAGNSRHLLLMRALAGLKRYQTLLATPTSWQATAEKAASSIEPSTLTEQASPLHQIESRPDQPESTFLRVKVTSEGRTKVQLSFASKQVHRLDELLDEQLRKRIAERGINLQQLAKEAASLNYRPMTLFELEESQRTVRVWLD